MQIVTSPYRRTRETTEGILKTLTAPDHAGAPSPFSKRIINVYEEPRIREQDFGNFQPSATEMTRIWHERADYGHFFYRIPNGESAADAYDRVASFNESLWRQFSEPDFPSVCVLVTHGLMARVFLMKWYHWSVEYFEDLRNIGHCEFIMMERNSSDKYTLQNKLRTWSELKKQRLAKAAQDEEPKTETPALQDPLQRNTVNQFLPRSPVPNATPDSADLSADAGPVKDNQDRHRWSVHPSTTQLPSIESQQHIAHGLKPIEPDTDASTPPSPMSWSLYDAGVGSSSQGVQKTVDPPKSHASSSFSVRGVDPGTSGISTHSDESPCNDCDDEEAEVPSSSSQRPERKPTIADIKRWAEESGMGKGAKADPLGDEAVEHHVEEVEKDAVNAKAYEDAIGSHV